MTLESICDLIILVGGAYFMVGRLIDSWAKPTSKLRKRKQERERKNLEEVLDAVMPKYFEKHDLETRDKYLSDRLRYLNEIKQEVLNDTQVTLEEIRDINLGQNADIQFLHKDLEVLNQGTKDMLRQRIMGIYREYRCRQAFPIYIKEALDELYKDYKAEGGNSYIDKYYHRMETWKVLYEYEVDEE